MEADRISADDKPNVEWQDANQMEAGMAITQHLLDKGYRNIAFCAGQMDARVLQRASGWRHVLEQHGLYTPQLQFFSHAPTDMALGAEMFGQILAHRHKVDTVFFCNDDLAQGALLEAMRRGVRVPQDIAIAGFNDLPGCDQMLPPLTTVRTPRSAIGRESAEMLLQLMANQTPASLQLDLGFELMQRQST